MCPASGSGASTPVSGSGAGSAFTQGIEQLASFSDRSHLQFLIAYITHKWRRRPGSFSHMCDVR